MERRSRWAATLDRSSNSSSIWSLEQASQRADHRKCELARKRGVVAKRATPLNGTTQNDYLRHPHPLRSVAAYCAHRAAMADPR